MQGILLILALAVTVEAVVEYVKSIVKMFTEKDYRTAITQLSAAAIAIALCFAAGADLYAALGLRFAAPWIGTALTVRLPGRQLRQRPHRQAAGPGPKAGIKDGTAPEFRLRGGSLYSLGSPSGEASADGGAAAGGA